VSATAAGGGVAGVPLLTLGAGPGAGPDPGLLTGGVLGLDPAFAGTVAFALSAGVATFFAPCAYPLLPGYVGYYLGTEGADPRGALVRGVVAAGAALVVLGGVAGALLTAGGRLVRNLSALEPVVGAALVVLGALVLTGRAPELRVALPARRRSVAGFALFGAVYALAAAGCVVPVFLAVVGQSLTLPPAQAAVALGGYAAAASAPLAVVTVLAAVGHDSLSRLAGRVGSVQRLAGALMVVAGVWQVGISLSYLGVV
jgi:cytochrome c-type biogenesis protein